MQQQIDNLDDTIQIIGEEVQSLKGDISSVMLNISGFVLLLNFTMIVNIIGERFEDAFRVFGIILTPLWIS